MGVRGAPEPEVVRAWVERTCEAQGVPVKIRDPRVIRDTVALIGQSRQSGSTRSGSKRVRPGTPGRMIARSRTPATIAR